MHLPSHLINSTICPVSAAVAIIGIAAATLHISNTENNATPYRFATVAFLIFSMQMFNYPIMSGVSGHFLGVTLAIALLGIPQGIVATAMVIFVQALFFGDGGLEALGINIINMAFIGAIPSLIFQRHLLQKRFLFFTSSISVLLSALACSIILYFNSSTPFLTISSSLLATHLPIAIVEGAVTMLLIAVLKSEAIAKNTKLSLHLPLILSIVVGVLAVPFSSKYPDALEWVIQSHTFIQQSVIRFEAPFSNYQVAFIKQPILQMLLMAISTLSLLFTLTLSCTKIYTYCKIKTN